MLEKDQTVEATRFCLVRENGFPVKQWENVIWVSSSELIGALLNDWVEVSVVGDVMDEHFLPVPNLIGESAARREDDEHRDLSDAKTHGGKSGVIEEDSAEDIEEAQPPPGQSGRVRRTRVRISDTGMVVVEEVMTCEETMRGMENSEWKLALKETLDTWNREPIGPTLSCP